MCYYKTVICKLFKYANWQEKKMEELIKNGYDVKVCEGKHTEDSWSEISWMNAKEGRKGELTEIKGEC